MKDDIQELAEMMHSISLECVAFYKRGMLETLEILECGFSDISFDNNKKNFTIDEVLEVINRVTMIAQGKHEGGD